jgi:hypothetical protein
MSRLRVTEDNFLELLSAAVPEAVPLVDEHLADYDGDLLIHLLTSDLLRFATAAFGSGELLTSEKVLTFVGSALDDGDERVKNAVAVSFVEHVGAWPGETPEFIDTWPASLLNELNWRPFGR